jgi:hypothetical protein
MEIKPTQERRAVAYLTPKNDVLLRSYADVNEITISEAINKTVKDFFQRLPPEQKIDYLSRARTKNNY